MFANGDVYVGEFKEGKAEGEGEFLYANGQTYRGQFKNGLRHGKGIWRRS